MEEADLQEQLEALDPATRTLLAEVDLGQQMNEFVRSDIGKHLIGCIQHEVWTAQESLSAVSPWRFFKVQELQNRVWRAKFMLAWISELLAGGKSAQSALNEQETGE